MIRNMQIRSKLIAVLVIPLVALTVLAALGIGANVARGVQADRVNDQTAFAVSLSTLVHELQRERDLSAGWVGSGRDAGYGGVVTQLVAVNEALQTFRRDVQDLDNDGSAFRQRVDAAVAELNQLDEQRDQIENNPGTTVQRTLDYYSRVIAQPARRQPRDRQPDRRPGADPATSPPSSRWPGSRRRPASSVGASTRSPRRGGSTPATSARWPPIVGAQEAWRTQFEATATPEQQAFFQRTLQSPDIDRVDELRDKVLWRRPQQARSSSTPRSGSPT